MKREKHVGFRIENELHAKMVYIAAHEGRSLNWQMIHLMQTCVRGFEQKYGPIPIAPEDKAP